MKRFRRIALVLGALLLVLLELSLWLGFGPRWTVFPEDVRPKDGGGTATRNVQVPPLEPVDATPDLDRRIPPPVDLDACDRDLDLFGFTVDEDGVAVPGATVECVRYPWRAGLVVDEGLRNREVVGPTTVSSRDGSFSLRLRRGDLVALRATAPGLGQGDCTDCMAGERVTLVLRRRGATLSVRTVLASDGAPVAGASLEVTGHREPYGAWTFERRGVTDADGRCVFEHLPPGRVTVRAQHPERGRANAYATLLEDGTLDQELRFDDEGRVVTGRVLDGVAGAPLAGATVRSASGAGVETRTGEDGGYRLINVPARSGTTLTASAPGFAPLTQPVSNSGDLDFPLLPGLSVTGRTVDGDGRPVAGARVSVLGSGTGRFGAVEDHAVAETGTDGVFLLVDLSGALDLDLIAASEGRGRVARSIPAPEASALDLGDLVLPEARAIEGVALDGDGGPLAGAAVVLSGLRTANVRREGSGRPGVHPGTVEMRRTDDLGRFRFPGLAPGLYGIKLNDPGSPVLALELELGADEDRLDIVLRQAGGRLELLVTDVLGRPIPGACVRPDTPSAHPSGSVRGFIWLLDAFTGDDGRVALHGLPRGPDDGVTLYIRGPEQGDRPPFARSTVGPIPPDGREVTVVLRRNGWLEGRILGPDGSVVEGLEVAVVDASGSSRLKGHCDAEGHFRVDAAIGEPVSLRVGGSVVHETAEERATGFCGLRGEWTGLVAPRSDLDLRARAPAIDGSVDVLVLDFDGRPMPGHSVFVREVLGSMGRSGDTDEEGRIRFDELLRDRWILGFNETLSDDAPADHVPPVPVEITPEGQRITLRVGRGVPLEGTVRLPDGGAAVGARVHPVSTSFGRLRATVTGADGRFRVHVQEGVAVSLRVNHSDANGGSMMGYAGDLRGGRSDIEITLRPRE